MSRSSQITQLIERRRLLVTESGRLREQLADDISYFASTVEWAEKGYSVVQSIRPLWPLIVAGAGFLFSRKRGGWLSSLGKVWSFWKIARKAATIWQQFSAR